MIFKVRITTPEKDILVVEGAKLKDIAKKYDVSQKFIDDLTDDFKKLHNGTYGGFCYCEDGKVMIVLEKYRDDWEYWENLIHEVSHATQFILESITATDEQEFRAYLSTYIFREIRLTLQNRYEKELQTSSNCHLECSRLNENKKDE